MNVDAIPVHPKPTWITNFVRGGAPIYIEPIGIEKFELERQKKSTSDPQSHSDSSSTEPDQTDANG